MPTGTDKTTKVCDHCGRRFKSAAALALHMRHVNGIYVNRNTTKTHCSRNHRFTPANTRIEADGHRSCRTCRADSRRKYLYGMEVGDYDAMLKAQGGKCALCKKKPSKTGRRLAVDHNHVTGEVRGLLCAVCNRMVAVAEQVGLSVLAGYLR